MAGRHILLLNHLNLLLLSLIACVASRPLDIGRSSVKYLPCPGIVTRVQILVLVWRAIEVVDRSGKHIYVLLCGRAHMVITKTIIMQHRSDLLVDFTFFNRILFGI